MRVLTIAGAMLLSSALLPVSAQEPRGVQGASQAQNVPVQPDRTREESNRAREEERARSEGVRIAPDWKAQESDANRLERPDKTDQNHQTVGQDWRARPEGQDKR